MRYIFLIITLLFGCADTADQDLDRIDLRQKSFEEVKHVGSYCSESCIWSKYAVELGAQNKQANCVEGPCACVRSGDIYESCSTSSEPQEYLEEATETVQQPESIPYYNQYDNANYGWATCQNTSVAMVLSYYEKTIHPDTIFVKWGKDTAQSPSGLNLVYSYYASKSVIRTYTNASPEELKEFLRRGFTAIVHGYFTQYGHVLVVTGFDGEYYYVNDPAGQWKECFKCGYGGSYNGVTRYHRIEFEKAVFTSNGSSYLPGWIHIIN